ncbi:MAG TPA: hypothetical protein ENN51_00880, partial [candidate division WOR-3 bacterium]|nr:hypothetical protein [candidate division WOR-3 bacterium]
MRVLRQAEFWFIVASAAVLTIGHYAVTADAPFWHHLFRRLYYLPMVIAGFRYGLAGGLLTAAAISLAYLPHIVITRHTLPLEALEARFEIPLY